LRLESDTKQRRLDVRSLALDGRPQGVTACVEHPGVTAIEIGL
jgi:hypothetical protein